MSVSLVDYILRGLCVCFPSVYLSDVIAVHRWDVYKDKEKMMMSDVKYIYLFFKVNKCSGLIARLTS